MLLQERPLGIHLFGRGSQLGGRDASESAQKANALMRLRRLEGAVESCALVHSRKPPLTTVLFKKVDLK